MLFRSTLPFDLNLQNLVQMAGLKLPNGFDSLLDVSGNTQLNLDLGARLQLRLGMTLPAKLGSAPTFSIEDYNASTGKGTRLALNASLAAPKLDMAFKVVGVGLSVSQGSIALDDGNPATADAPARLDIRYVGGKPQFEVAGGFDLNLPISAIILGKEIRLGRLQVATDPTLGIAGLLRQITQPGSPNALVVKLPDFDVAAQAGNTLIKLLYDPTPLFDGVDQGLGTVQDLFQGEIGRAHV